MRRVPAAASVPSAPPCRTKAAGGRVARKHAKRHIGGMPTAMAPRAPASSAAPRLADPYSYAGWLAWNVANPGAKRKGERTRDRILAETARLLNAQGFRGLRQTDICEAAGIGVATFYLYFTDKLDACGEVLRGFTRFLFTADDPALAPLTARARADADPYAGFYASNLNILRLARRNTGLFRCFLETAGETDVPMQLWREVSLGWYQRVARRLAERGVPDPAGELELRTVLAGGMVDEFLRGLIAGGAHGPMGRLPAAEMDEAELVRILSDGWYRLLLGRDPPAGAAAELRRLAAI